jgi:23S rRNA (adenine2503-C2)-methyltransferase
MKKKILEQSTSELRAFFTELGHKPYHANQVIDWVYNKGQVDIALMTNLSVDLRQKLAESLELGILPLSRVQESNDRETVKFLWQLEDGKFVESVLIMSDDRRTVCVSSQVGCPARCAFCASGRQGLIRNLKAHEIVAQVYQINLWLAARDERVSHIVYMGMGEPFRNYEEVVKSIRLINDPDMLNISQRRITVSTVGVIEGIKRFTNEGLRANLVLSLHAPNQDLRKKIIPYARQYELADILQAMQEYTQTTGRDITYEYTLLSGINDAPEHAEELARLLRGKQCTVNLIPYNPVMGLKLKKPTPQAIQAFRKVLDDRKIINTCRYTKGDDIAAACGQLAMQEDAVSTKVASPSLMVVNE